MFSVLYHILYRKMKNSSASNPSDKNLVKCKKCGKHINSEFKFCRYCGNNQKYSEAWVEDKKQT